jgi:hypothetical protein
MIESPLGLVNMKDICKKGVELSENGPFQLEGVIFGYDDFSAEVGRQRFSSCNLPFHGLTILSLIQVI